MNTYNIDRDINLYSFAELETMQRIWNNKNANHSHIPFNLSEINNELDKRNPPEKAHFTNFFFCEYTNTLRVYPQNYWLASCGAGGKPIFNSWDGAIVGKFNKKDIIKFCKQVADFKAENSNIQKELNGRFAVIVKNSEFNTLGVQYWAQWQIKNKVSINTDNTTSYFISKL